MNLHQVAGPIVAAVNPPQVVNVQVSVGSTTAADGTRKPAYETPGQYVGSIAGDVLTVTSVLGSGVIQPEQTIFDGGGLILPNTTITGLLTGTGRAGTYSLSRAQTIGPLNFGTSLTLVGQIQSLTYRDLQQIEGLNLQGTRRAIYFPGSVDGVVRFNHKGGDLLTFLDRTMWLTAMVLEHWGPWCKVAATLQDGVSPLPLPTVPNASPPP